jgi:hypothetical protein
MSDAPLKLLAFDAEDLAILSAHLQDAELSAGDFAYLPRERRFAFVADRFDWEGAATRQVNRRRRAAVHFEHVRKVQSKGIDMQAADARLNLLAVAFEEVATPEGVVQLHFSGGGCIRLEVECIEGAFKDLGPEWRCAACPSHAVEEGV